MKSNHFLASGHFTESFFFLFFFWRIEVFGRKREKVLLFDPGRKPKNLPKNRNCFFPINLNYWFGNIAEAKKTLIGSVSSRNWITIFWSRWKLEPIGIEIILQNCFSTSMQSLILLSGFHYSKVPPIWAKTAIFWTDLTII